jgi:hypothetical protein
MGMTKYKGKQKDNKEKKGTIHCAPIGANNEERWWTNKF